MFKVLSTRDQSMAAKQGRGMMMMMPIVSKVYCSPDEVVRVVRRRPKVPNGGGLVVADCGQKVVFKVDGCGILGKKEEMVLRDGEGNDLLLVRRKGAMIEALSLTRRWKGFTRDFLGSNKLVFTLKEPNSCFSSNSPIRISAESTEFATYRNLEIMGDFQKRSCTMVSSKGDVIAQIGVKEEVKKLTSSMDLYYVRIKAGIDEAFVFGVIAVLDYIYDGSTRC